MDLENHRNGEALKTTQYPLLSFDTTMDSCSSSPAPFGSDPSSPGRAAGYYFSCPASPVHYVLSSPPYSFSSSPTADPVAADEAPASGNFEFDGADPGGTMTSADELFLNGLIRPIKVHSHVLRPRPLPPLMDFGDEDDEEGEEKEWQEKEEGRGRNLTFRSRSVHRRTRSMSPLRSPRFQWQEDEDEKQEAVKEHEVFDPDPKEASPTPPESASSSRSSSSSSGGRNSKRWIFLKDLLLYRSKSEGSGRGNGKEKEKFWHSISFSPSSKPKAPLPPSPATAGTSASSPAQEQNKTKPSQRPANGIGRRRGAAAAAAAAAASPSAHERHYTANRAQSEEMRRRTFLPYRQGLLGCLGFSSRSYTTINGLAKALNPVSSG
ncbi:unnamed protein product [Musa acuminata subsp. malaccensis]|uniref:(wild Malaysian banana) hypothetical protein n=1 Tax=Musa acuminata subsp. malaccensis TaxID=214687 RepID=A0A804J7T5_MUSAM|nr:PREDICTED: uncharacterized protein LOC103985606 [Musa acuminata subsp. malaccensis]CAG1839391.1 unnamed protein product [Musa acuminata subsp. malaccensis]